MVFLKNTYLIVIIMISINSICLADLQDFMFNGLFRNENSLIQTSTIYSWNGNNWDTLWTFNNNYNEFNKISDVLKRSWAGEWVDARLDEYSYDYSNNLVEITSYSWNAAWSPNTKIQYEYNKNNMEIKETYFDISTSHTWTPVQISENEYENGNRSSYMLKIKSDSVWLYREKEKYFYTDFDSIYIEEEYNWVNDDWKVQNRTIYSYDTLFRPIEILHQKEKTDFFVDSRKTKLFYQDGSIQKTISYRFENEQWNVSSNSFFDSYPDLNYCQITSQIWDNDTLQNNYRNTFKYDTNYVVYESIDQNWLNDEWHNSTRTTYTYQLLTDVESGLQNFNSYNFVNIYPNPISSSLKSTIQFILIFNSNIKIDFFNNLGIEIAEIFSGWKDAGTHTIQFSPESKLPAGAYWIRLTINNKETIVKPVLILK